MDKTANNLKAVFLRCLWLMMMVSLAIYLLICVGLGLFQRRMIYFPPRSTSEQVDASAKAARLERWRDASGQAIGLKRLASRPPAAGQVLIVYGNASCATGCAHYVDDIQSVAAFGVFVLEYPGCADRAGSPSQKNFFAPRIKPCNCWPQIGRLISSANRSAAVWRLISRERSPAELPA